MHVRKKASAFREFNAASAILFAIFLILEIGGLCLKKQPALSFGQDAESLMKEHIADHAFGISFTAIFHPRALVDARALPN